jgi:peptide/nickel transport system substrate-binding protein
VKVLQTKALVAGVADLALALTACSSSGGGSTPPTSAANTGGNSVPGTSSAPQSTSASSPAPQGSGVLKYGESTEFPDNLQQLIAAGNSTAIENLVVRMFNGPYRITPQIGYELDPDQVVGTPTNKLVNGQQVVEFKINPKAVWDDGTPITTADWQFTWQTERSTNPKQGGCASLLSTTGWDQIQSIDAPDDHTVKITFKKGESYPDWQILLASAPLSKHVYDQGSAAATCAYITKGWPVKTGLPAGVTNGPWILNPSNIDATNKVFALTANPKYWGAPPKLQTLVDQYIGSDSNTNVTALQNQEVGMIYPQPQLDLVANLQKLTNVTTEINFGTAFEHLDFNTKVPLLDNLKIRQAIAYAINREALVKATVGQFSDKASVLGNRLILSNQQGYEDHSGGYAHQDLAKSKALLQSAGCTVGNATTVTTCNGKPLKFAVETTQDNPLRDQTIQIIAQQVKANGIQLTEDADPDIFAGTDKPHSLVSEGFQIALFAWVGGPNLSGSRSIYISPKQGQQQNYSQIGTPQIDSALNKMATSVNTNDEKKWANAADKLLWDQMGTLPLYQKPTLLAFASNYKGIGDNPTLAGPLWNSDTFSVAS